MPELKTQATDASVDDFIAQLPDPEQQADAQALRHMMTEISGQPAVMWGKMIGFGRYNYTYPSGHQGSSFALGFAPRKTNLTVYIVMGFDAYNGLMGQLGKYKTGKSCLYIRRLRDIDHEVLRTLLTQSLQDIKATYPD